MNNFDIYNEMLSQIGIEGGLEQNEIYEYIGSNEELFEFYNTSSLDDIKEAVELGTIKDLVVGYDCEQENFWVLPHRYSRKSRFKSILFQLLNISGEVPQNVKNIVSCEYNNLKISESKIWNQTRNILKKHRLQKYYNMIPSIIKSIKNLKPMMPGDSILSVLKDFDKMHWQFNENLAKKWNRNYFPNLRYIALKLCARHGITHPYTIPLIRTVRKQKYLNTLFKEFILDDEPFQGDKIFME